MEGGIDDVGIGVLFGLDLYRYDFAGLLMHAEHLEAVHRRRPPHHQRAPGPSRPTTSTRTQFDNGIADDIFAKIVAVHPHRRALHRHDHLHPGEPEVPREQVLHLGISQISGGSRTSVGGYAEPEPEEDNSAQFDVSDNRTLDEVVNWLHGHGLHPQLLHRLLPRGPHRRPVS